MTTARVQLEGLGESTSLCNQARRVDVSMATKLYWETYLLRASGEPDIPLTPLITYMHTADESMNRYYKVTAGWGVPISGY